MNINVKYIASGKRHRPMTNPSSSLYKKKMCASRITVHEAWSTMTAEQLHNYVLSDRAAARPASWHFSVDRNYCGQSLPWDESGWHAGDNLGPGNTRTYGTEISDRAMRIAKPDPDTFWLDVEASCKLHAHIITKIDTLLPFPDCLILFPGVMAQHNNWSGKNCPALLRGMPNGWAKYLEIVEKYIKEMTVEDVVEEELPLPEEETPITDELVDGFDPDIDRTWIDKHKKEFKDDKDPYQDLFYPDRIFRLKERIKFVYPPQTKIISRNDWVRRSRGLWKSR